MQKLEGDRELDLSRCQLDPNGPLCQKILELCPKPEKPFEWPWRTTLWSNKFGNLYQIRPGEELLPQQWLFEGTFSKIHVKTRSWEDRTVIQGLQVFLDDETVEVSGFYCKKGQKKKFNVFRPELCKREFYNLPSYVMSGKLVRQAL